jgi:hypothetical protein
MFGLRAKLKHLTALWLLLLAGCSSMLLRPSALGPAAPGLLPDAVRTAPGTLYSSTGCTLEFRTYRPAESEISSAWVVLAHGFLRSQQRMRDLAAAMAAEGLQVATVDFCNQRPWNGRHVQNGRDMDALARHLDAERVVYAGFSAGGLAALIAGRADPAAVGVLTLDLVETKGLGLRAARGLDKPLLALAGGPTNCNADANGTAVYRGTRRARVQRFDDASHCDFESPTDRLCELICADPTGTGHSQRRAIITSATAAAKALLDGTPNRWPGPAPRPDRQHLTATSEVGQP